MPLIFTPRQLAHRSELYHQLAALLAAGVPLIAALETLRNSPPSHAFRSPLTWLIGQLNQGSTFAEALLRLPHSWLPSFDVALIGAGENSGRLDQCFRFLSEYYNERARLARQIISQLAYPALVLHMAILIFPTGLLTRLVWQGDIAGYALAKLAILVPLYAAIGLGVYLGQAKHGESWRSVLEQLLRAVPVLGAARANLALARLSAALESLLNAGVPIVEAWELAGSASGSPALRRAVHAWKPNVEAGQTPAEAVRESGAFPDLFANLYATGEVSGQLDATLARLYRHYEEEALRKFHLLAQWMPRLIYLIIVLFIAYQVVAFWSGYFSQIGQLTG